MCIDLHLHSIYSDGTATPAELVRLACRNKLRAIALTDHDTLDGLTELFDLGRQNDLQVIAGLEISAAHREFSLHILGYGMDHTNPELNSWLDRLQHGRIIRNRKIIARLQELGLDVSLEELESISCCGQAGRPHIARMLLKKEIVDSMDQAFARYLRKGAPAWAARFAYTAAESIAMIHRCGGIAVLAHPGQIDPEFKILPLLVPELAEQGLDGLEVYYPTQSNGVRKRLRRLACKYNLVVSGGSDYHGTNRTFSAMAGSGNGFCPPDSILPALLERIKTLPNKIPIP